MLPRRSRTVTTSVPGLTRGTTPRGSVNAVDQFPVTVPAGTKVPRFDLASNDSTADVDLDLVDVTIAWSGLTAETPYLGWVEYQGGGTIVSLNP